MDRKCIIIVIVAYIVSIAGCVVISPAEKLNNKGHNALAKQNYQLALDHYKFSLIEAEKVGDRQYGAIAMYGIGRANGYLCNSAEAETWLLKSIAERKSLPDTGEAYISQNHLELARLYVSVKQWKKAIIQFEYGVPLLESYRMETSDPIGMANVLDDYHNALVATGGSSKAENLKGKIERLRSSVMGHEEYFIVKPYPTDCGIRK